MNKPTIIATTAVAALVIAAAAGGVGWWMGRRSTHCPPCEGTIAGAGSAGGAVASTASGGAPNRPPSPPEPGVMWKPFRPAKAKGAGGKGAWIGYHGKKYAQPVRIEPVERKAWNPTTPLEAYRGLYSANLAGDRDWLLACYAPDERAEAAKALTDEALDDAKRQMQVWSIHEVVERIDYGPYVILLVRLRNNAGGVGGMAFAFKQVGGRWYTTNELADDPFATILWDMAVNLG